MADPKTTELQALREIIAAMWGEYSLDQNSDYRRINRLIEDAADIVANAVGGMCQFDEMVRNQAKRRKPARKASK